MRESEVREREMAQLRESTKRKRAARRRCFAIESDEPCPLLFFRP